jgi:hypothetical protein
MHCRHSSVAASNRERLMRSLLRLTLYFCLPALVGCADVYFHAADARTYVVAEGGRRQEFHVVNIYSQNQWIPAGPRQYILLTDQVPAADDRGAARRLVGRSPASRHLDNFYDVGTVLTRDDQRGRVMWIVGNDPFVIAAGEDKTGMNGFGGARLEVDGGTAAIGGPFQLVAAADLHRKASRLYVLDRWPRQIPSTLDQPPIPADRRVVEFSPAMTLGAIFDELPRVAGLPPPSSTDP